MNPSAEVDYQALFRALPENFLLMNPDATIVDNTDSHVAASLKPREQALGRTLFEAYPSVDQNQGDVIEESHKHVRQHLAPHVMPLIRYDLALPAEQGGGFEEMYWQATHYPVLDEQGQLKYILQRTQNVTEQHRAALAAAAADRALADAHQRTQFLLESLPVFIWTADAQGQRDFFNARWLAYTGLPMTAQTGTQWLQSIHPDDQKRVVDTWQQCVQNGQPYQAEYRLRRHDGQYRWVLVRAQPRFDSDDKTVIMWAGGAIDVHEQRQMVQELLEANEQQALLSAQAHELYQQAEKQRETYHGLFMDAPAVICILRGPQHLFEFTNRAYQRLFPHHQAMGRPVAEVMPEVQQQGFIDLLDRVYRTGEAYRSDEMKVELETTPGAPLRETYFSLLYQQFQEKGKPAGIMVFGYEVTELVRARQELERLLNGGPKVA